MCISYQEIHTGTPFFRLSGVPGSGLSGLPAISRLFVEMLL